MIAKVGRVGGFVVKMCSCVRGENRVRDSVLQPRFRHVDGDHLIERMVDGRLGKVDCKVNADGNGCVLTLPLGY